MGWVGVVWYYQIRKEPQGGKRYKDMIKTWKVWGAGLTTLYIIGRDVDEVLAQARLINSKYDSVQLYSMEG